MSDRREKENICKLTLDDKLINIWLEIKPVIFNYRKNPEWKTVGYIAQDVIALFEKYGLDYRDYDCVLDVEYDGELRHTINYRFFEILTTLITQRMYKSLFINRGD